MRQTKMGAIETGALHLPYSLGGNTDQYRDSKRRAVDAESEMANKALDVLLDILCRKSCKQQLFREHHGAFEGGIPQSALPEYLGMEIGFIKIRTGFGALSRIFFQVKQFEIDGQLVCGGAIVAQKELNERLDAGQPITATSFDTKLPRMRRQPTPYSGQEYGYIVVFTESSYYSTFRTTL